MADYKDVHIGNNTPFTIENLNQMTQNDAYNYERLYTAPRGVLAWKKRTTNVTSAQSVNGATASLSLAFTCEGDRQLRIGFSCRSINTNVIPQTMTLALYIDTTKIGNVVYYQTTGSMDFQGQFLELWLPDALEPGAHTLNMFCTNEGGATYVIAGGATYPINMWVEDCGGI